MSQTNPKVTPIAINAKGGLMTNIVLTITASKADVIEDPNYNDGVPQGLQGYRIDTQPGAGPLPTPILPAGQIPPTADPQYLMTWLPNTAGQIGEAYEPLIFGGADGRVHGAYALYVGSKGTVILQLTTNSPNGGGVLLREWN